MPVSVTEPPVPFVTVLLDDDRTASLAMVIEPLFSRVEFDDVLTPIEILPVFVRAPSSSRVPPAVPAATVIFPAFANVPPQLRLTSSASLQLPLAFVS
ncbi:MAG TPA: hypothetical protein VNV42_13970 [Solirubrobacteraceae bacterium]|nr:hypothetical protein [Solirubrobacteraceae bacterium]